MTDAGCDRRAVVKGGAFTLIAPIAVNAPSDAHVMEPAPVPATSNHPDPSWTWSPGGIVATEFNNLGISAVMNGQLARAEALHREACEVWKRHCGSDNWGHALLVLNLTAVLSRTGRHAEATRLARRALACLERKRGAECPTFARGLRSAAAVLAKAGRWNEAEAMYRRALEIDRKWYGPDYPGLERELDKLADVLRANGRAADADGLYDRR